MQNLKIGNSFALQTPKGNFMIIITDMTYDFDYNELFVKYDNVNLQTREVETFEKDVNSLKSILDKYNK